MKRALAFFMAFAMMTSALPVTAMAEDTSQIMGTTGTERTVQSSMEISVDEIVKVDEDGTVTLQDVELTAVGTDFEVGETLKMTLSSGFGFDEEGEEDSGLADIQIVGDKLELTFTAATNKCNISNMEIDALTAPVGAVASLTITGSNRGEATTDVAVVVGEEKTVCFEIDSNDIVVNGKKVTIDRPDPAIWKDKDGNVMIAMRAASQILQKLNENVAVTWDTNAMVAEYTIGNKTVELTVGSDIAVVNGKNKAMETDCIMKDYADGSYATFPMRDFFEAFGAEDWHVTKGEGGFNLEFDTREPYMELDIPKLQILEEGTVSYDTFGVDTVGRDFKLDEIVTLTIGDGFEFVESPIHDHDGTILQNVEWSADGKTVKVPVYKAYDTGFDMEAMTIKATTAEVGDEALLTVSAEHYPDVSKVIAKVVDEITETPDDDDEDQDDSREPYMKLDIPKLQVLEDGTVSYNTFGVDTRYRDFKLNEIVTLTISDGFEFVESPIHDHDGTILQNVEWSADGKTVKVPVYKAEDTGFDMEAMTIKATTAKIGDEALLTVSAVNYPDVSQVIATVADPNALNCSISVDEIVKVEEGDSVTLEDVEIEADGIDFTNDETLTLTLSEGFVFVTNAKIDTNQADIVSFTKDELVLQPKKATDEIVIEDMEIKVTTAEVGDIARLAIVGDKRVSAGVKVAKVVDVADDTYMDVYVYGRKIVSLPKGGEVALRDVVIDMHDDDFDYKEEITLELNEGFEFVNLENISADYNNNGTLEEASSDELVIEAEKGVGKLVIEGVCIKATTAEAGDMAVLTAKHGQFEASTEAAEVVCSEIVLDVKAKTVKNGGKATFDVFGVDKKHGAMFVEGEEVILTLSEGFAFVKGSVYDHDGTEIEVAEWDKNRIVYLAPADPGHGFDMEGLIIHAESAKPGEVAKVTAHVDGYEDVTEDVLTVVKASSGGGGGSSKKEPAKTETPKAETDTSKLTMAETTTAEGTTTTVDTTSQTLNAVAQEEKAVYHEQLSQNNPTVSVVGDGAYTFAVAAAEETDATVGADVAVDAATEAADSESAVSSGSGVKDPEKVSFDLSGQNLADTSHLTLVKYVTQPDGTVEVVKLGGAFDPETNTFSAYADGEGVYDLVHDPDVTKITFAIGQTEVSMNDEMKKNDVAPILHENKTMVPLRSIAQALGAEVVWDESIKTVHIVQGDKVLSLAMDGDDGTAMIMNDRTMVQLRYIGENFGASVRWIPSTQSIEIVK